MRPVFDLVGRMTEAWAYRFKTLPDGIQEIIRTYNRVTKGVENAAKNNNTYSNSPNTYDNQSENTERPTADTGT